jgi:hypothetical protein
MRLSSSLSLFLDFPVYLIYRSPWHPVPPFKVCPCDRPEIASPGTQLPKMGISLVKAQLLSLGLTTFLYGASAPKSLHCSHLAFALADIHMDRIVLHALPRHNCGDVFQGVGGHPEAAQDDPPQFRS